MSIIKSRLWSLAVALAEAGAVAGAGGRVLVPCTARWPVASQPRRSLARARHPKKTPFSTLPTLPPHCMHTAPLIFFLQPHALSLSSHSTKPKAKQQHLRVLKNLIIPDTSSTTDDDVHLCPSTCLLHRRPPFYSPCRIKISELHHQHRY